MLYSKILPAKSRARRRRPAARPGCSQSGCTPEFGYGPLICSWVYVRQDEMHVTSPGRKISTQIKNIPLKSWHPQRDALQVKFSLEVGSSSEHNCFFFHFLLVLIWEASRPLELPVVFLPCQASVAHTSRLTCAGQGNDEQDSIQPGWHPTHVFDTNRCAERTLFQICCTFHQDRSLPADILS